MPREEETDNVEERFIPGLLIVQFFTVHAERLLTHSLNPIVHQYHDGEPTLGIVVMKTFLYRMVSRNLHGTTNV